MSNKVPIDDCQIRLPEKANVESDRNAKTSLANSSAEIDAILKEGAELARQGKLDAEAAKRIDAKLRLISDRLDQNVAQRLDEIKAQHPTTPPTDAWKKTIGLVILIGLISVPLEFTVGESFVFSFTNTYLAASPVLFAVLVPAFAVMWFRLELQHALAHRYPTWSVRWLLVFPIFVFLSSSMMVFSPFGWSALAGWAIGASSIQKTAKVLSVEPVREQARIGTCNQTAKINIDEIKANICIQGRIIGSTPKVGDAIAVTGRDSFLGFYIEQIRVK